jgi:hypothetical protein
VETLGLHWSLFRLTHASSHTATWSAPTRYCVSEIFAYLHIFQLQKLDMRAKTPDWPSRCLPTEITPPSRYSTEHGLLAFRVAVALRNTPASLRCHIRHFRRYRSSEGCTAGNFSAARSVHCSGHQGCRSTDGQYEVIAIGDVKISTYRGAYDAIGRLGGLQGIRGDGTWEAWS